MTLDSVRVALRGVLANRMRSALTMLGILIGTAAVILLVGVGQGISDKVQDQIKSLGTNAIYVIPERNSRGQDRGGTSSRRIRLTQNDVEALSDPVRAPALTAVTPAYSASGTLTWQGTTYSLSSFTGAEPVFGQIRNATVSRGRWLEEEDVRSRAKVAVIGVTVIDKLFGKGVDPVGQQVEFNGIRFRIIGVLEPKGSNGFQDQDDVMVAPISTVRENIVGNVDSYNMIAVQAASRDALPQAMTQVNSILRRTHHIRPSQPPDFVVFNAASLLAAGKAAAKQFQLLLGVVAGISLLIGGIGVMNIMLVSVTERTREIGVRKAIGARRSDIMWQFLIEAATLTGFGGLVGLSIGWLLTFLLRLVLPSYVPLWAPIGGFVASVGIGLIFGIWPAWKAARLDPIESLRYE
jgi:putative ABC transport system permease protein